MEEFKILGKVTDAKLLVSSIDRRTKRMNGLSGLVIEFETNETITTSTVVYLKYEDKYKPFAVREVEIVGENLLGICEEVGYYAHKLGLNTDLDLRTIVGCEIELVENPEYLKNIMERSLWC